MSYKTILVSLNEVDRAKALIDVAAAIADKHGAHLTGLFVIPALHIYPATGLQVSPEVFEDHRRFFTSRSEQVEALFEDERRRQGFAGEWRLVETGSPLVAEAVIDHALPSDLVVASQGSAESTAGIERDCAERIVLESGRPVLVVPYYGRYSEFGHRVLIAWNATREAARAAFDSVPLLIGAESVHITWVDPQKTLAEPGSLPGAELATALSRHGIRPTAEGLPTAGLGVGEALLSHVADVGADLLVMGAYGHSRMREFILGGATRTVLQTMTVPVLMSH